MVFRVLTIIMLGQLSVLAQKVSTDSLKLLLEHEKSNAKIIDIKLDLIKAHKDHQDSAFVYIQEILNDREASNYQLGIAYSRLGYYYAIKDSFPLSIKNRKIGGCQ